MYFSGARKAKATHAVGHVLSKLYVVNVLGKVSFFYFLLLMILTTLIPSPHLSHFKAYNSHILFTLPHSYFLLQDLQTFMPCQMLSFRLSVFFQQSVLTLLSELCKRRYYEECYYKYIVVLQLNIIQIDSKRATFYL